MSKSLDYRDFSKLDKADGKVDETNYPKDLKAFSGYIYDRNYKSAQTKTDYQIGYFRKFNALHNYIVNTFAYGVDECQDIFLYKEDVEKIKKVLDEVLEAHTKEKAEELLCEIKEVCPGAAIIGHVEERQKKALMF